MTGRLNFDPIQAGDPVQVVFDGSTPDIFGTFQRFIGDGTYVITTPQGEDDPDLQTTHYIDNCQYVATGTAPSAAVNSSFSVEAGDNVTVYFGTYGVPGDTDDPWTITGDVTKFNSPGVLELDVGGQVVVCKDYWYIEKN